MSELGDEGDFARFFAQVCARLGLAPDGYRRTRGSVRKRVGRRVRELGLNGLVEYRRQLDADPEEWARLDQWCRITISRFARDAEVYRALVERHLPAQAAAAQASGRPAVNVWSAGCASGEEPYGVAIAWRVELEPRFPDLGLAVLATDADPTVLARAERGCYPEGSLRELPPRWLEAFERHGDAWRITERYRAGVSFQQGDLRGELPPGPFDVVLCRNVAFTYFDPATQRRLAAAFAAALRPGGVLVVGRGERIPASSVALSPCEPALYVRDQAREGQDAV